jgi:hypothetical protein
MDLKITSITNISFSKIFKVFKNTDTIENNIELGDFIRDNTIVYDVPENINIPTTKTDINLRSFLNTIYISPQENIGITISNAYITSKIIMGEYINNFNLYNYLQTLDIYNIKSNILKLIISLNIANYQFVDNTSQGAFVINMDDFTTSFNKLTKIEINNDMYITGKHGGSAGNSTSRASTRGKGGDGASGTDGYDAVVINSTQASSIEVEINDVDNKIIGGFGAQGGNGGNGGTENIYLYYSNPQYTISRAQGGEGGQIKLTFTDTWIETIENPYHPHVEDNLYHIIRSGEMHRFGIFFDRNYIDADGRTKFYLYDYSTSTRNTGTLGKVFSGQVASNGQNATSPSISIHNARVPFSRNNPLGGNRGSLIDGYYNSSWTSDGGNPGTNGSDAETHSYNPSHITVNYITN